jgi:FkbH-like protein
VVIEEQPMVEPVRLVVWDLDDTFWQGTLTEGGMSYRQDCHDIVVELARRGILSSICSKNDEASVRPILEQHQIWDYFVFPSINWDPKGPRIAALIETVQLRPATVMFIDDNPMNLNEAVYYVPELQIADETVIPGLLDNPLLKGKNDSGLTRLTQYKLLERRKQDETAVIRGQGDRTQFLRDSNIRVRFEYDLETHIDRVVELVNRTNQLNFTKQRLPENAEEARIAARQMFSTHDVQAGLIRVSDNYGDYGYCGFYAMRTHGTSRHMFQYAFSCRILGLRVEHWLYSRLGRPRLKIIGDVSSNLFETEPEVDWITVDPSGAEQADAGSRDFQVENLVIRGGCDLTPVAHYCVFSVRNLASEFNTVRNGIIVRIDHSAVLRLAADEIAPEAMASLERIGYAPADFRSGLFTETPDTFVVLSFAVDAFLVTYRHKHLGFRIPFWNPDGPSGGNADITSAGQDIMDRLAANPAAYAAALEMKENYIYEGFIKEARFKSNLTFALDRLGPRTRVIILRPNDHFTSQGTIKQAPRQVALNRWLADIGNDYPAVRFLYVRDFIQNEDEVLGNVDHLDRNVYHRLYQGLMTLTKSW